MYPEKKGGSHKMARPQQNWGLLTLLIRWASIWTMPNTASPKFEPPCGRAVYTPVRAAILGHPPQKTAPGGWTDDEPLPKLEMNNITYASMMPQFHQTSNISGSKSQNWNVSRLVLQLSLPNPLKPSEDVVGAAPKGDALPTSEW